jgi:hypothetical protein
MACAEFAVLLLGRGAYRSHESAFAVSQITFRTGDRATDSLTSPVRASISTQIANQLSRSGDFTMTASRSSFTAIPKRLTNSRLKPISGTGPGQLVTNHFDMRAAARRRSTRLKRETITLLCAIVVASTGRPTWGQLAHQPPTQDATLITENDTPIGGTTFSNWVASALTEGGNPNAASAAFYFQECFGGGVLYDLTNALKNAKVP